MKHWKTREGDVEFEGATNVSKEQFKKDLRDGVELIKFDEIQEETCPT